ncbi:hypothetical protein FOCC_FOCC003463 [Frankliniella occidentalis]|uniref:Pre-mRNA-splicing factor 18 n=1 Tax=Frankliniella occidentalis TaxID=133901 RepID=A0A6J1SWB8_FRAOC|nr:pre-mRNA-splicing factor 18 [Frankliniella occidentalis]KAE8749723.1 hypothetical protein FOCC_FOCC003463 [Frankliniella occidentalis]
MEAIKAEIARKRKQLLESNVIQPSEKYFRRGDLLKKEEEDYQKKYGCSSVSELSESKASGEGSSDVSGPDQTELPRREVIRRLRERGEPIFLFGESEAEAFQRLRRVEILEPEVNKGFRNDFQEAMERVDQGYLDELVHEGTSKGEVKVTTVDVTWEDIHQNVDLIGKGDRDLDMKVTLQLLQLLLRLWGEQLNNIPAAERRTTKVKIASATYSQTQTYLKPLLRKLRSRTLPEDISDSLTEITKHLLDRNYLKASDAYLQMAIGNAPWPIGVTMVGIHARTGREKIFSKNVAHVLNDETQRKYIQALKRLMTKCQEFFTTDPSRCVEYTPKND